MREILFRAKRICDGEWIEGFYVGLRPNLQTMKPESCHCIYGLNTISYDIDPETLCQYTGLTDKNGKRIWENDIIVCKQYIGGNFIDYHIVYGFVEMKCGAYGIHRFKPNAYYRPFKDWLEDYEYEVIGNCFDNPELLEGE